MAIDFNALRARKGTNMAALQKTLDKTEGGGYKKDERIWKPTNKDNKSSNIIRFLPISFADLTAVEAGTYKEEDLTPMAKIIKHYFQGPKGWYIENSPQTFGEADPVREHDQPLWKVCKERSDAQMKAVLMKRLPATEYYANVLVIKDGAVPENNGKVFLYQFGETVRKLIEKANNPEFETDVKFDPFDIFEGAALNLNLTYEKKVIGNRESVVPNFSNVKWGTIGPLGDEAEMERVWKASYSLQEFYDRKNFKSYDELKAKFAKTMGLDANMNPAGQGSTLGTTAEAVVNESKPVADPVTTPASTPAPATPDATPEPSAGATSAAAPAASSATPMDDFEAMLLGN